MWLCYFRMYSCNIFILKEFLLHIHRVRVVTIFKYLFLCIPAHRSVDRCRVYPQTYLPPTVFPQNNGLHRSPRRPHKSPCGCDDPSPRSALSPRGDGNVSRAAKHRLLALSEGIPRWGTHGKTKQGIRNEQKNDDQQNSHNAPFFTLDCLFLSPCQRNWGRGLRCPALPVTPHFFVFHRFVS